MASDERRRQLVGLGLKALTERPVHEVALDDIAQQAGISRGLLFHYFPTKTVFYEEVVAAAGRRVARTVRPDEDRSGRAAIDQFLQRWIAQVVRRRSLYVALVRGNLTDLGGQEVAGSLQEQMTAIVLAGLAAESAPQKHAAVPALVHAWLAYVEDLLLTWSGGEAVRELVDHDADGNARTAQRLAERPDVQRLVAHCQGVLDALLQIGPPDVDLSSTT